MAAHGTTHVVGAGLAGLAAAAALARGGHRVTVYEAAPYAGGRCRSYFDGELGCRIDNGNHLLLAGNASAMAFLDMTGARGTVEGPDEAVLPFVDAGTGERWRLRPNPGRVPWWLLSRARRVPGTRACDYLAGARLRGAAEAVTVAGALDPATMLYRRLWEPFAVAALNTAAGEGSARLFARVVDETLGRGGAACRPLVPREGLSETFVDPALAMLEANGAEVRFGARLRGIEFAGDRVAMLDFGDESVRLEGGDRVVLAVPGPVAARLIPELIVPDDYAPIVNAHYPVAAPDGAPLFAGIVGGTAEWVFTKKGVISVTVSAADKLVERPADELAAVLWDDVAMVYGLPRRPVPPARIVKERRATFRATPAQLRRRPRTATRWSNLVVAGDYVDTGLPATIEGAIRSGFAAAGLVSGHKQAG